MENQNKPEEDLQLNTYRDKLLTWGGCLFSIIWLVATFYGFYALVRDLFFR